MLYLFHTQSISITIIRVIVILELLQSYSLLSCIHQVNTFLNSYSVRLWMNIMYCLLYIYILFFSMQNVIHHIYLPFSLMLICVVLFLCFTINIIIIIIINIIIDNRRRPVPTPTITSNCTGNSL